MECCGTVEVSQRETVFTETQLRQRRFKEMLFHILSNSCCKNTERPNASHKATANTDRMRTDAKSDGQIIAVAVKWSRSLSVYMRYFLWAYRLWTL